MSVESFEHELVAAAFDLAAKEGWRRVSVPAAVRHHGGLEMADMRRRFPGTLSILKRFGHLADEHALQGAATEGPARDRLFDMVMRRIDFLQRHRAGVIALLRHAPTDPLLALWLARSTLASMEWMLEGAGISARGPHGAIRARGLLAVWLWTVQAWLRDESEDLSATMAALDKALMRAEQAETQFGGHRASGIPAAGAVPEPGTDPLPDQPFIGEADDPARPG